MIEMTTLLEPPILWYWLIPLLIWSTIWKGLGLWKSARNKHLVWFIVMFVFNTAGILPIIYIVFFQENKSKQKELHHY